MALPGGSEVKNPLASGENLGLISDQVHHLEEGMATHSSILA